MHIIVYCPGMPFHGGTIDEGHSLGGSESAAFYLAREMARMGAQVTVFTHIPPDMAGKWDGVRYLSVGEPDQSAPLGRDFEWYATSTPHDVLIIQRVPDGFRRRFASKVNLWWSHDLALKRHQPAMSSQLWNVDRILAVSDFHREQIATVYGMPEDIFAVIRNGIDPALYTSARPEGDTDAPAERKKAGGLLIYSSRPERGLSFLVEPGGVMERLGSSDPDLTLLVAGYDNTTAQIRPLYERLWSRCRELSNVELIGAKSKKELADLMGSAYLHVYPTTFEEVSCITAMEAQAAGTPIVTTRVAALPETLEGAGAILIDPDPERISERFEREILELRRDAPRWDDLHRRALAKSGEYEWQTPAKSVLNLAENVLREKCSSPRRLARHLIRNSDIMACLDLSRRTGCGDSGLDEAVKRELNEHYRFVGENTYGSHYEAIARWQEEQGLDHGLADPDRVMSIPRLRVVEDQVSRLPKGSRVLDFGCGQGHFTCALARRYPGLSFTGVDIAPSNVAAGNQYIAREGLSNVRLVEGEAGSVEGIYDLIVACEVLEHVPDPGQVVDRLERNLVPGGTICLTVPYGPWEAESYETIPFRTHIHHLERPDLLALWGHKPDYQVVSVPVRDTELGEPLGAYRVIFREGGEPSGKIDIAAKLVRQAPRETVSICMICRDDGHSLARTLDSIRLFADQLVIAIDGSTSKLGPAWAIAERYGAESFPIESPLETGFAAARNQTLERAWGDWVLWIDDDEVFEWPERLAKYLRPNGYDAYAIKQHHYSVEPEGIIKTDMPCRLFRRREGVKFFGLIHEHPERGLNKGFRHVLLLPDIAICHGGYDTEAIRRQRFHRNLPLMVRDRKINPDRLLGKFLWIRDLAHLNRYALEQGSPVTPRMRLQAEEAIALWRDLLAGGQVRMAVDALPYYSEAVQLIAGDGIDYEVSIGASRAGIGDLNGRSPQPVRGRFIDTDDIHKLTQAMMREKTAIFEEKYF